MRFVLSFFVIIFLANTTFVFAQDQCAVSLSEAEDKYEAGRLYEIPEVIEKCLVNGFTDEEKVRAYRLLTLTNLFLNYQEKADSSLLKLLKLSPLYETNEELDPLEIINLSEKFTTKPIFYLSSKIGFNISRANVLWDYSISKSDNDNIAGSDLYDYSPDLGFIVGAGGEMVIWKNLHLAGELLYSRKSVLLSESHFGNYTPTMEIIHRDLEIPIMLKYNFFLGKINPFCYAGASPSFLFLSSINNLQGAYSNDEGEESLSTPLDLPNINKMKNRFNYSTLLGAGINYKLGLNYLSFEARLSMGMLNVTNVDNRFNVGVIDETGNDEKGFKDGRDLKFPFAHVDDDFKIDNLSILFGFVRPLYKPRKIK